VKALWQDYPLDEREFLAGSPHEGSSNRVLNVPRLRAENGELRSHDLLKEGKSLQRERACVSVGLWIEMQRMSRS
jgi:hypothetical protein